MAWTKAKTVAVLVVVALLAGAAFVVLTGIWPRDLSWETPENMEANCANAHPQLTIIPTKFGPETQWQTYWGPHGTCMGINVTVQHLIQTAYRVAIRNKGIPVKVDAPLPEGKYDFICNLSRNASNALCKAITAKFGVTASHQMIDTDILVLAVRNEKAGGLKPPVELHEGDGNTVTNKPGHYSNGSVSMKTLAKWLTGRVHVRVVDQTDLTGKYSLSLEWDEPDADHRNPEGLQKALLDQLGLELKPDTQPVEMLVIEKAK